MNSNATFPLGVTTNAFSVADALGNSATCAFTVTVTDNQLPTISCPTNVSVNAGLNTCSATVSYTTPVGTDNCTGVGTLQLTGFGSGASFPVGVTTNSFRTTDGAGNTATCAFTVTVIDSQLPTWSGCPANQTAFTGSNNCLAVVAWTAPVAGDNCAIATSSSNHSPGATFVLGVTTVTYIAEDPSGNTATCSFTVTVSDNTPPTATCQPLTIILNGNGNGSTTASIIGNGSSDGCGIDTMTLSQTAFTCANAGPNTLTLTVTDVNGNTSTCTAIVTVQAASVGVTAIQVTNACGYSVSCSGGNDGSATASGTGGCPSYTYLWSDGQTTSTATGLTVGTYTVTITDASGITAVATVSVTAPPPIQLTSTSMPSCPTSANGSINLGVSGGNSCQAFTYLWSNGQVTQDMSNIAPGTYNVTVTDARGCTGTATVTVGSLALPVPTFTQTGNLLTADQVWPYYQWVLNGFNIPGANSPTYTITQSGIYQLTVTDSSTCPGVSVALTIVGIKELIGEWSDLMIYPNPARGEFRLKAGSPITYGMSVAIYDMFGKKVHERQLWELMTEVSFDLNHFAVGTYVVDVVSEFGERRMFKLVVQ